MGYQQYETLWVPLDLQVIWKHSLSVSKKLVPTSLGVCSQCFVAKSCCFMNLSGVTRFRGASSPGPMGIGQILGSGSILPHLNLSTLNVFT